MHVFLLLTILLVSAALIAADQQSQVKFHASSGQPSNRHLPKGHPPKDHDDPSPAQVLAQTPTQSPASLVPARPTCPRHPFQRKGVAMTLLSRDYSFRRPNYGFGNWFGRHFGHWFSGDWRSGYYPTELPWWHPRRDPWYMRRPSWWYSTGSVDHGEGHGAGAGSTSHHGSSSGFSSRGGGSPFAGISSPSGYFQFRGREPSTGGVGSRETGPEYGGRIYGGGYGSGGSTGSYRPGAWAPGWHHRGGGGSAAGLNSRHGHGYGSHPWTHRFH